MEFIPKVSLVAYETSTSMACYLMHKPMRFVVWMLQVVMRVDFLTFDFSTISGLEAITDWMLAMCVFLQN